MVLVNGHSTFLDHKAGIAVYQRFGHGELLDYRYELIKLDAEGWAGPLTTNGEYYFRCTFSSALCEEVAYNSRAAR